MSDLLRKALSLITGEPATAMPKMTASSTNFLRVNKNRPLKKLTERELITLESQIGVQIFGELPKGTRREFFCLDASTWIWHESDKNSETTIRYEVHDNGILKVMGGARYEFLEGEELNRFVTAVQVYYEQVARNIYHRDPRTGQKIN